MIVLGILIGTILLILAVILAIIWHIMIVVSYKPKRVKYWLGHLLFLIIISMLLYGSYFSIFKF